MKKLVLILTLGTIVSFSATAQNKDDKKKEAAGVSLSVGAELGIPTGELGDFNKLGFGGSAKLAVPVFTNGAITLNAGYLTFSGKTVSGFAVPAINVIPVKAGLRYNFSGSGFYVEPQLGVSFAKSKGASESETAFTWAPNVGYLINNMVDISARYESFSVDGTAISHIGFRVAYNFNFGK